MTTPEQPPTPEQSAFARFRERPWALVARDLILGVGFVVIIAGSLANIALLLESRGDNDEVQVSDTPRRDAAGAVTDGVGSGALEVTATPAPRLELVADGETAHVPPPYAPSTDGATSYTVVLGDVLYEIALRHGTTPGALAELNDLPDPNLIEVGQVLLLPSRDPDSEPATEPTS